MQADLVHAYDVFAQDTTTLVTHFTSEMVKPDGWQPTQGEPSRRCFPMSPSSWVVFMPFKISVLAPRKLQEGLGAGEGARVTGLRCDSRRTFAQRLRRLWAWTQPALPASPMKRHTLERCEKRVQCSWSDTHRYAHRTSSMMKCLMKFLDRVGCNGPYRHGTLVSAEGRVRSWLCYGTLTRRRRVR